MNEQSKDDETQDLKKQIGPFLSNNPHADLQRVEDVYYILKPWNDDAITFELEPDSSKQLIDTLNNLVLPPRFTAIYHLDSNTLEFIYGLLGEDAPEYARQFTFLLSGKKYICKFAPSTSRLLLLSRQFRPGPRLSTPSTFRNLLLIGAYELNDGGKGTPFEDFMRGKRPISFNVSGFDKFDENEILLVSKHLNFFMSYYDRKAPNIIIHHMEEDEPAETPRQLQFIETSFPENISSKEQDSFLLDLTLAASEVQMRLQFIYYYQILEYASFYIIDDELKRQLLRIISAPDIHANPEGNIAKIIEAVGERADKTRQDEQFKIERIVRTACSHLVVWKELEQNSAYFSKKHEFDGGFVLEPIIDESSTAENFSTNWHTTVTNNLRHIRNALVHAREKRGGVISPTRRNDLLIRPWVSIARRVAEQVIIFGEI